MIQNIVILLKLKLFTIIVLEMLPKSCDNGESSDCLINEDYTSMLFNPNDDENFINENAHYFLWSFQRCDFNVMYYDGDFDGFIRCR